MAAALTKSCQRGIFHLKNRWLKYMLRSTGVTGASPHPAMRLRIMHGCRSVLHCVMRISNTIPVRYGIDRTSVWRHRFRRLRLCYGRLSTIHEVFLHILCGLVRGKQLP